MNHPLIIERTTIGSELYRQAVALREAVLRKPLGLTLSGEDLEFDAQREHFVALLGDTVVGSVSLHLEDPTVLRIKQMAVVETMRGQNIGAQLMKAAEDRGRVLGASLARLHARCTAEGFYLAQGYRSVSEIFIEHGIDHRRMEKTL